MGGGYVLRLAASDQGGYLGAAVPYYGFADDTPGQFRSVTAPIQAHYGEQDAFYPIEQARKLEQQLREESSSSVEFFYYPAGHAFNNDQDRMGTYDQAAAELAWSRTVSFLHEHLG
jgi:carboxymethylenebutenolidase